MRAELQGYRAGFENIVDFECQICLQSRDAGAPYTTGATLSGIMLDGGFDMARSSYQDLWECYEPFVSQEELRAIHRAGGLVGEMAASLLAQDLTLQDVRVPRDAALVAMQLSLASEWRKIVTRWPGMAGSGCPAEVQEAVLDLVWCRGIMNGHVKIIARSIATCRWEDVGHLMSEMQQRSKDKLTVKRRRFFANQITELYPDEDASYRAQAC